MCVFNLARMYTLHCCILKQMDADAQSLVRYAKFSLRLDLQSLAQGEACSNGKAPGKFTNFEGLMS